MCLWYGKVFLECEEESVLSIAACSSHIDMLPFFRLLKQMILSVQATPFFFLRWGGGRGCLQAPNEACQSCCSNISEEQDNIFDFFGSFCRIRFLKKIK